MKKIIIISICVLIIIAAAFGLSSLFNPSNKVRQTVQNAWNNSYETKMQFNETSYSMTTDISKMDLPEFIKRSNTNPTKNEKVLYKNQALSVIMYFKNNEDANKFIQEVKKIPSNKNKTFISNKSNAVLYINLSDKSLTYPQGKKFVENYKKELKKTNFDFK